MANISMEIIFLGAGNAFTKKNYHTNLLVRFPQGHLLIDCGFKTPAALHRLKISVKQLRDIFISHTHADHIGGLEEVLLQAKYLFQTKPKLHVPQRVADDLWEHSLRAGLQYTVDGIVGLDYYAELHPLQESFSIANTTFELIPTKHIPGMPSYGLYFNQIFYSGDTIFDPPLLQKMLGKAQIVIHDCSFKQNPVHTYYEQLLTLPKEDRKKIYLIHYNDASEKQLKYMEEQGFHYVRPFMRMQWNADIVEKKL